MVPTSVHTCRGHRHLLTARDSRTLRLSSLRSAPLEKARRSSNSIYVITTAGEHPCGSSTTVAVYAFGEWFIERTSP